MGDYKKYINPENQGKPQNVSLRDTDALIIRLGKIMPANNNNNNNDKKKANNKYRCH